MKRRIAIGLYVLSFISILAPIKSWGIDLISNITTSYATGYGFSTGYKLAFVFQTGPSNVSLNQVALNLLSGVSATSQTINYNISMYAVDGSNNPTGTALSTDSASATWTNPVGGSLQPQIFTYSSLTNMFALNLSASTKYALVLSGGNGSPVNEHYWGVLGSSTYTTNNGFSVTEFRSSSDNGSSWSFRNAYPVISISAVPEPSTWAFAGISAIVIGCMRKRRASGVS